MGIKARYDGKQDRMLLIMEPKEGDRRVFWVTRRQWVGLYGSLGPLKPEKPEAKQPPAKPQPLPESLTAGAELLDGVRVRRKDDAVQIGFVSGDTTAGMQEGRRARTAQAHAAAAGRSRRLGPERGRRPPARRRPGERRGEEGRRQ
jgi:hypothetical protein